MKAARPLHRATPARSLGSVRARDSLRATTLGKASPTDSEWVGVGDGSELGEGSGLGDGEGDGLSPSLASAWSAPLVATSKVKVKVKVTAMMSRFDNFSLQTSHPF